MAVVYGIDTDKPISSEDRKIIRDLAKRTAELSSSQQNKDRIELWKKHNSLKPVRPMILVFPEGGWTEILPDACKCSRKDLIPLEWSMRAQIYEFEHFQSDNVIDPVIYVQKVIHDSGWGIQAEWQHSHEQRGARTFKPVILEPVDLKKIKKPIITYDEPATQKLLVAAQELLGDIMPVQLCGVRHISFHFMNLYTSWRGLEEVMIDMYENPDMLHEAMSIIEEGYQGILRQNVEQNLLSLNNDNTYHSSGGNGWTDELPAAGFDSNRVRLRDMWGSAESQELAQVSPEMHEQFALRYERKLLEQFALSGYGCCEDLTRKLDDVLSVPNMRRVSISPWADVEKCAERLGGKYIFSWKPHPAHLVGEFNQNMIRDYIRHAVKTAQRCGCVLEMILKDTHSCNNHPERFDIWSQIARQVVTEEAG